MEDRDENRYNALVESADRLAMRLKYNDRGRDKWVSPNEMKKVQSYLIRHKNDPDPWSQMLNLLSHQVHPRSSNDWRCIKNELRNFRLSNHSTRELCLILGWSARLLKYYAEKTF